MTRKTAARKQPKSSHEIKKNKGCTGPHHAVPTTEEAEQNRCTYVSSPKGDHPPYKSIKNRK